MHDQIRSNSGENTVNRATAAARATGHWPLGYLYKRPHQPPSCNPHARMQALTGGSWRQSSWRPPPHAGRLGRPLARWHGSNTNVSKQHATLCHVLPMSAGMAMRATDASGPPPAAAVRGPGEGPTALSLFPPVNRPHPRLLLLLLRRRRAAPVIEQRVGCRAATAVAAVACRGPLPRPLPAAAAAVAAAAAEVTAAMRCPEPTRPDTAPRQVCPPYSLGPPAPPSSRARARGVGRSQQVT